MAELILTPLKNITTLTTLVTRILGLNPSQFTLLGTNTYLVGRGAERIIIDTGQGVEGYKDLVQEVLNETKSTISTIFITHQHIDHISGIKQILGLNPSATVKKKLIGVQEEIDAQKEFNFQYQNIQNNEIFQFDDFSLQAIYTPGHINDHMAFLMNDQKENKKTLFCGDIILGEGSAVIEDLQQYLNSLEILMKIECDFLLSAHGVEIVGRDNCQKKIKEYYNHRILRENQILESVTKRGTVDINEILNDVYPGLQENLKHAAKKNIVAHINRLIKNDFIRLIYYASDSIFVELLKKY